VVELHGRIVYIRRVDELGVCLAVHSALQKHR
jgi:hypothetical protein